MPRLDFTRAFFQIGGFAVAADDWFAEPQSAAAAAQASGAPVVVAVAPDAVYPDAVPALIAALPAEKPRVIVAGYPRDQIDALRAAGVQEFIHLQSDAFAVLNDLARRLGVFGEVSR